MSHVEGQSQVNKNKRVIVAYYFVSNEFELLVFLIYN
jgi:hypothetical protein